MLFGLENPDAAGNITCEHVDLSCEPWCASECGLVCLKVRSIWKSEIEKDLLNPPFELPIAPCAQVVGGVADRPLHGPHETSPRSAFPLRPLAAP